MLGEGQAVIPNFSSSSIPNPNPNPLPPPTDELNGLPASESVMISQTTDMPTYEHNVANNVAVPRQLEIIQPVYCEVCNVTCNRGEVLEKHKLGKKHLKNLQKQAIASNIPPPVPSANPLSELEDKKHSLNTLLHCDICHVVCTNQDAYEKHLAGKKHSAKAIMRQASTSGILNATSENSHVTPPNTLQPVRCDLCNISCTSNELLNIHISGKKHQRKLQELQKPPANPMETPGSTKGKVVNSNEGKSAWCELCGIGCDTSDVLKVHISGRKHQKNLKKSQKPIGPNPAAEPGAIEKEDGSNKRKAKEIEDVEAKRQKMLLGGATEDALRACTVCNVVCNSPTVYISHLAGQKHVAMVARQAETGSADPKS